jgi:hypothetical protein
MTAEVKFSIPVPALDALRRIMRRDFDHDQQVQKAQLALPEKERDKEWARTAYRNESDRALIERALGFEADKDEIGSRAK